MCQLGTETLHTLLHVSRVFYKKMGSLDAQGTTTGCSGSGQGTAHLGSHKAQAQHAGKDCTSRAGHSTTVATSSSKAILERKNTFTIDLIIKMHS